MRRNDHVTSLVDARSSAATSAWVSIIVCLAGLAAVAFYF